MLVLLIPMIFLSLFSLFSTLKAFDESIDSLFFESLLFYTFTLSFLMFLCGKYYGMYLTF